MGLNVIAALGLFGLAALFMAAVFAILALIARENGRADLWLLRISIGSGIAGLVLLAGAIAGMGDVSLLRNY
jgi:hypothetical protein